MTNHEIDAAVATKVMGWRVTDDPAAKDPEMFIDTDGSIWYAGGIVKWSPSTDMNHAMEVVALFIDYEFKKGEYGTHIAVLKMLGSKRRVTVGNDSLAMAICLAALRSVGKDTAP